MLTGDAMRNDWQIGRFAAPMRKGDLSRTVFSGAPPLAGKCSSQGSPNACSGIISVRILLSVLLHNDAAQLRPAAPNGS